MTAATPVRPRGFLSSAWTAVIAGGLAITMLTLAAVVYLTGRPAERVPAKPVVLGEPAPSDFSF
ncbi:MAG: hypothetical protein KIT69_14465, partial [Propionibacteriaceae bacterium]|nr:hypothetical protein [Propionibacteriaceae bacterium]